MAIVDFFLLPGRLALRSSSFADGFRFCFFRCRCYKDEAAPHCIPSVRESVCLSIRQLDRGLSGLGMHTHNRQSQPFSPFSRLIIFLMFIFCAVCCPLVYRSLHLFHRFRCMWKRIFERFHDSDWDLFSARLDSRKFFFCMLSSLKCDGQWWMQILVGSISRQAHIVSQTQASVDARSTLCQKLYPCAYVIRNRNRFSRTTNNDLCRYFSGYRKIILMMFKNIFLSILHYF